MNLAAIIFGLMIFATPAFSDMTDDIRACSKLTSDKARLACFDLNAKAAKTPDASSNKPDTDKPGNTGIAAAIAVRALRGSLRDPDSLVLDIVTATDKAICIQYRAKNGFGGVNREMIAFYNLALTKNPAIWNKHCAGSNGALVSLSTIDSYLRAIDAKIGGTP